MARLGLEPKDIDFVVNSQLHFDHAGGNCVASEGGRVLPAFPRATYIEQEREWEEAHQPHERHRASYRKDDFDPLVEAGQLRLVRGTAEIAPGVLVEGSPLAQALVFTPRDFPGIPGTGVGVGEKVLEAWFTSGDPRDDWAAIESALTAPLAASGVVTLGLLAPFIPVVPGTPTYADQLW